MKTLKFIATVVFSIIVAMCVAFVVMQVCSYEYAPIAVFLFVAIATSALLGAFRVDGKKAHPHQSIKNAARYQKAA